MLKTVLAGILASILASGCATQFATTTTSFSSTNQYHKVYLIAMEHDPRNVQPKIVSHLEEMGFEVEVVDPDQPSKERQGTGFFIGEGGNVLTCAHVVGDQTIATIWLGGERFYADVASTDTNLDIALLKVELPAANKVQGLALTSAGNLKMGQDVYTMGFPLSDIIGKSPRLTKGLVSSTVGFEDNPRQLQISAEVQSGSSGGPLLDEHGEVVGMITATLSPLNVLARTGGTLPQNVNFAIKSGGIEEFLKQAGVDVGPPDTTGGGNRSFDEIKESVVLVRSGKVLPGEEDRPELICRFGYQYLWDMYWRFQVFYMEFTDLKTGKVVLKAGQFGDNLSPEETTIRETFKKVHDRFLGIPAEEARRPKSNRI